MRAPGTAAVVVAVVVAVAVVAATTAGTASAQHPTEAEKKADALFEEGRALMEARNFQAACPKFEQSQRLDPGLGTLLNLAACYEEVGKLASALTAFRSAEEQARAAGPTEKKREVAASERARALESRVARLTITLAPGDRPSGFTVTRDGSVVSALDLGRRLPVDPGTIVIEASAPGFQTFRTSVSITGDKVTRAVDVPALQPGSDTGDHGHTEPVGGGVVQTPVEGPDLHATRAVHRSSPRHKRHVIAAVVGGVGATAFVGGVGLGFVARAAYNKVPCTAGEGPPVDCTADEEADIRAARNRGTQGTIVGGAGLALLGAGVVLWLTAPKEHAVEVAPMAGDGTAGLLFTGTF